MQLKIDSFLDFHFLGQVNLIPNNEQAVFLVGKANVKENGYDKQIWIYDEKTKKAKPFSSKEVNGFYALDGDSIVFTAKRKREIDKKEEKSTFTSDLYRLPLEGGEAQFLSKLPFSPTKMLALNEDELIFLGTWKKVAEDTEKVEDPTKKAALEASVEVIDEIPYWFNGRGFINKVRNRLFLYKKSTGEIKELTGPYSEVLDFDIAPGKEEVAYIAATYENVLESFQELHLLSLESGEDRIIREEVKFHYSFFGYLSDKKLLFVGSDGLLHGNNQDKDIYTLDRVSMEEKQISPKDWNVSLGSSVGSDARLIGGLSQKIEEGKFYFSTTEFDHSYLNVIDEEGKLEKLTTLPGTVDSFDVNSGKIYAVLMRELELQELYEIKEGKETKLTHFNDQANKLDRAKLEDFDFELNNINYKGYVLLPSDYDPAKKYPGILSIHGGPKAAYGTVFFQELHYFAQRGYIVFFTNPRGSDGRGRDFSDIRGEYGKIDYDNLMDFTDEVLNRYPCIDVDKLGVMGGSYGGFMTNWIIGHTHRFAAACSQRSISNWFSKFGITDIGYSFNADQQGTTPWEDFEHFWEVSPIKHAPNAKTPTLLIHSDEDHRCHYSCAMQMHTALKLHGVDSRFVLFHGENHELSRSGKPKERIRRLQEIYNWFEIYLKGEEVEVLG